MQHFNSERVNFQLRDRNQQTPNIVNFQLRHNGRDALGRLGFSVGVERLHYYASQGVDTGVESLRAQG